MSALDYWHPVLGSRDLSRDRVAGVRVAGHSIAVFRTADGRLGAVEDQCAHRRMKLSVGKVRDGRLVCPYHGWTYSCEGEGESPSSPRTHACITSYECIEAHDAIWVKASGSEQAPPALEMDGWDFVGAVFNKVNAPLEHVIDNFSEIEHTVATHPHFGLDPDRVDEAVVKIEATEDSITVRNHGPAKLPPWSTRLMLWVRRGDFFHSDYTFRFDPPRSSVAHWWCDAGTARERMVKYHVFHYFVPEDENRTQIVTFGFLKVRWPLVGRLGPAMGWLFRQRLRETVAEDVLIVENLADKSTSLEGMKLGRFDQVLGMTRQRIQSIYRGSAPADRPAGGGGLRQ